MKLNFLFVIPFLLLSRLGFCAHYEVIDLGPSSIEQYHPYAMNNKGDVASVVDGHVWTYKNGIWNDATPHQLFFHEHSHIEKFANDGSILVIDHHFEWEGDDYWPFLILPDGKVIDFGHEIGNGWHKEGLKFTSNFVMNENGYIVGEAFDRHHHSILFSFSTHEGLKRLKEAEYISSIKINNKNQILIKADGNYFLHTPGKQWEKLGDFGVEKFITHFCGYYADIEISDLSLSDTGMIAGTIHSSFFIESKKWNFGVTSFAFTHAPDGKLYVSGISEFMKYGKSHFKDYDQGEPVLFYTGKPVINGHWTAFCIDNHYVYEKYWPLFKSEGQSFPKEFAAPKQIKNDEDRATILNISFDAQNMLQVVGQRKGESDFAHLYFWSEKEGFHYVKDLIQKEWKPLLQHIERDGKCVVSPNGNILVTCVFLKGAGERAILLKHVK